VGRELRATRGDLRSWAANFGQLAVIYARGSRTSGNSRRFTLVGRELRARERRTFQQALDIFTSSKLVPDAMNTYRLECGQLISSKPLKVEDIDEPQLGL
jgi:hypothetical protein